eukprot:3865609-Prymnesium_polylepis.1
MCVCVCYGSTGRVCYGSTGRDVHVAHADGARASGNRLKPYTAGPRAVEYRTHKSNQASGPSTHGSVKVCVCVLTGRRDVARGRGASAGRATDTAGPRAVEYTQIRRP